MSLPSISAPTGAIYGPTLGISRNMEWNIDPQTGAINPLAAGAPGTGGGNLNGTQATTILYYQAGTNATRWQMARHNKGNYCGIV
jgi:hypothetical protein